MEVKVLGSSSKGNCYVISDGKTRLLLDCGLPVRQILQGIDFQPQSIAGCLVTHSHGDHVKSAAALSNIYGIRIYASAGCLAAAHVHGFVSTVKSMRDFTLGTFRILPFDVQHDAPEPLGFLLKSTETGEKLLYFTDTYYIKYRFSGLTHILCEANYSMEILQENIYCGAVPRFLGERVMGSHMSIDHLVAMLKANDLSGLKHIYLCHLSDCNSDAVEFVRRVQAATGVEVTVC